MSRNLDIRESVPGDIGGIERLYAEAFPDEDLLPLVNRLLVLEQEVISLVALRDNAIAGHVSFTFCHVGGGTETVALLAPLAVAPALHKQGIGSRLVQAGFERLVNAEVGIVLVLGDPAYYGRFGFKAENDISAPYSLPAEWREAWQSIHLGGPAVSHKGKLTVPEPWRQVSLWSA